MSDTIYRQAAIDALRREYNTDDSDYPTEYQLGLSAAKKIIEQLPSASPTLCGYNIEHLDLIARVLQKENLPPERVAESLMDIGRIVAIVRDEFEESLRKAVEQCVI